MFTKQRIWLHRLLGLCRFSKLEHRLYPHIDKRFAAYVVCKVPGCRNKNTVRDLTTEEMRNSSTEMPLITYKLD